MAMDDRILSRPLPEGKLYHVFLSYRDIEEDKEWVQQLISQLQNSYHFICCDHAVDFQAGRKIVENIKFAISNSMKTIVILTKEYNNSYWCEYEIEYALLMNMDMKERILIPVLKEDCKIPDYLRPFTYIDARGDIDTWIHKLVSAIESEGEQYTDLQFKQMSSNNTEKSNLEILHEEPAHLTCSGPVFHTRYVPNSLHHHLSGVSSDLFSEILNRIAATQLVKGRHCRNIWLPTTIFWSCFLTLMTPVWVIPFYLGITFNTNVSHLPTLVFSLIMLIILVVSMVSLLLTCGWTYYKGRKQIREILLDVNRKLLDNNIMVTLKQTKYKAEVKIIFLYFDAKLCMEYVKMALESDQEYNNDNTVQSNHDGYSRVTVNSDHDGEPLLVHDLGPTLEENARTMLVESSLSYLQDFIFGRLENQGINRHSRIAICLCQYLECKGHIKGIHAQI